MKASDAPSPRHILIQDENGDWDWHVTRPSYRVSVVELFALGALTCFAIAVLFWLGH